MAIRQAGCYRLYTLSCQCRGHLRNRNHSRGKATGNRRDHDTAYAARGPQNWISYRGPFADGYERSDLPSYWLSGVLYPPALQVTGEKVIALFMLRAYKRHTTPITLPPDAHILVVKLATIGDLLLATPALRALRETYPQAQIDLLVTPASAGLLDDWEVIDRVIVLDKYLFDYPQQLLKNPRNLLRLRPLWHNLRDGDYDTVLLLHHLTLFFGRLKHQLLMRATGAKWRIGLDNGHGWFLNVRVKDDGFGVMHEADYNLAVAKAAGATTNDKRLSVPINEEEYQQARRLLYETDPTEVSLAISSQMPDSKNAGSGLTPTRHHAS